MRGKKEAELLCLLKEEEEEEEEDSIVFPHKFFKDEDVFFCRCCSTEMN